MEENELLDDFQTVSDKLIYASPQKRLFATGIDAVILMGIYMLFSDLILDATQSSFISSYLQLLSYISIALYFALGESGQHQGTLGKQFVKIKVVDKRGNRIGFWLAFGRFVVKMSLSLILLIVLFFGNKNKPHGGILGTYVVAKKS